MRDGAQSAATQRWHKAQEPLANGDQKLRATAHASHYCESLLGAPAIRRYMKRSVEADDLPCRNASSASFLAPLDTPRFDARDSLIGAFNLLR